MKVLHDIGPANVSWRFLSCQVQQLERDDVIELASDTDEQLLVLVEGTIHVTGEDLGVLVTRPSPFTSLGSVVYLPPRFPVTVHAVAASEIAIGSAPAEGRNSPRVVRPDEMTGEIRGGGNATRQVVTTYGPNQPAERLIAYEAWVPRGSWTGWPPHRHDGRDGSPYLEETYYYRFDRDRGFGIHRNFDVARGQNDLIPIEDRTLVPVPCGYHLCAAGPSSNAWILNFLAGTPADRDRPALLDASETWITGEWTPDSATDGTMRLPAVPPSRPRPATTDAEGDST
ncbi:5-deoxy-glucuronate isomerase [Marmoricola sp. URHA0025 HA25]